VVSSSNRLASSTKESGTSTSLGPGVDAQGDEMKLRDFNTLTFDVVGTLIDFETGILDWFRPTLGRHQVLMTHNAKADGQTD
jgi:hypothetical protein